MQFYLVQIPGIEGLYMELTIVKNFTLDCVVKRFYGVRSKGKIQLKDFQNLLTFENTRF